MKAPGILGPGSGPVFDELGNLWFPAFDATEGPWHIPRAALLRYATGGAGEDPVDLSVIGTALARLLGVRPVQEPAPAKILVGPAVPIDVRVLGPCVFCGCAMRRQGGRWRHVDASGKAYPAPCLEAEPGRGEPTLITVEEGHRLRLANREKADHQLTDQQLADRYATADPDELIAVGREVARARLVEWLRGQSTNVVLQDLTRAADEIEAGAGR